MDQLKRERLSALAKTVNNALDLYSETSNMTRIEIGQWFLENEECRQNIYRLVALHSNTSPLGK